MKKLGDFAYRNTLLEKRAYNTQKEFERLFNERKRNSFENQRQNNENNSIFDRQRNTDSKKSRGIEFYSYARSEQVSEKSKRKDSSSSVGNESYSADEGLNSHIPDDIDEILPKVKPPKDNVLDRTIGVISTRAKNISPKIKHALRRFEFESGINENKYTNDVKGFITKLDFMTPSDYAKYDLALKNGNKEVINSINKKYDLTADYSKVNHK